LPATSREAELLSFRLSEFAEDAAFFDGLDQFVGGLPDTCDEGLSKSASREQIAPVI
jgi:hypothetical protein